MFKWTGHQPPTTHNIPRNYCCVYRCFIWLCSLVQQWTGRWGRYLGLSGRPKKGVVGQTAYRLSSWLALLTKLYLRDQTEERWARDVARRGFWLRKNELQTKQTEATWMKLLDEAETSVSRPNWWGMVMMMMMMMKSESSRPLQSSRCTWQDSIKLDLRERRTWTGFIRLTIGTSGMLLWIYQRTFHAIKCGEFDKLWNC